MLELSWFDPEGACIGVFIPGETDTAVYLPLPNLRLITVSHQTNAGALCSR